MKERLAGWFPYAIAIALPMAGVLLAVWRFQEEDRQEAAYILMISAVAGLIWLIALGAL